MMLFQYNLIHRSRNSAIIQILSALFVLCILPVTGAAQSPAPVNLGCAENFAILAGSTITSTGFSIVDGDIGLLPGSAITGFPPAIVVNGSIFINNQIATNGKICLNAAFNDAAGRTPVPTGPFLNPGSGNIGGLTLVPGLYKFTSSATLSGSNVTLTGGSNDVWIFQIGSNLDIGNAVQVILAGGAQAKNVFWQVGSSATIGTSSVVKGTIMAYQSISLNTGAQLDGRALASIGAVTLDGNTITRPPTAANSPTVILTVPSSSSVGIVASQNITATFSEAMDAATITNMTFTLRQGTTPVAGIVSYSGNTATFDPDSDLASNTMYTATVSAGVKNLAGVPLSGDHVWTFTTAFTADVTAPTVSYTVPTFAAVDVSVNQRISATFSEAMNIATISTSSFTLRSGSGSVIGTVDYVGVTATFTPSASLATNTLYIATITTQATDVSGNPLSTSYIWSFSTGPFADTTPPGITFTVPANAATSVPVNQILSVTFNEAIDPATITTSTFLVRQGADAVAGIVSYSGVTATFTPALPLKNFRTYTATITAGVKDLAGNALAAPYVWSFLTSALLDIIAPTVSYTNPVNAATGVNENQSVSATFSEAMDPLTINNQSFVLMNGSVPVSGSVTYGGVTAIFTPTVNLIYNTRYDATLTTMARDLAGHALPVAYTWSFTTGEVPDLIGPTVVSMNPANATLDVPVNHKVSAMFSEAIDPQTVTTGSFTLFAGITSVPGSVSYVGVTAVFTPLSPLKFSTVYTARLSTGIKDLAGNAMESDFVSHFVSSAELDDVAPTVRYTVPLDTATGVPVNQRIAANFSEPMDPQFISSTTFMLKQGLLPIAGMVTYTGRTATFSPAQELKFKTTYTATISAGIMDLAGNAMLADHVWSFTTGESPDYTAPAIVSTNPENDADRVMINTTISAVFNKEMDPLTINSSFTLFHDGLRIPGFISYSDRIAVLTPFEHLTQYTTYIAVISAAARDLAGNAIAADFSWSFTTGGLLPGPATVDLDCTSNFSLLSGASVNSTGNTIVNGDLGISPGSALTGFPPGQVLNGSIHLSNVLAQGAKLCMTTAYNDAAARTLNVITLTDGELGGRTLPPGLYRSAPGYFGITYSDLVLDAQGDPNAVWIFQMPSSMLTVENGRKVLLGSGAQARNIFWQVGASATFGINAEMNGTVMAKHSITMLNGAALNGRAFAADGSITLNSNIITRPDIMVSVGTEKAPIEFTLAQNYPNPFNPVTHITYGAASPGVVSLRVYNVFGVEVATLVNGYHEAGTYVASYNANDTREGLTSGVYFYRLTAENGISLNRTLILLK
jgi:hypothetical protein